MTTEGQGQDPITEAQQQLERGQNNQSGTGVPEGLTMEQVQQMIQSQTHRLQADVKGLASKVDSGLSAIRRDTQQFAKDALAATTEQNEKVRQEQVIQSMPEDVRDTARALLPLLPASSASPVEAQPEPAAEPQPQNTDQFSSQLSEVQDDVRAMGIKNVSDSRIDYQALWAGNRAAFLASLGTVRADESKSSPAPTQQTQPAQPTQPAQQPQVASPPVETNTQGTTSYNSIDDVWGGIASGRIPVQNETERQAANAQLKKFDPTAHI